MTNLKEEIQSTFKRITEKENEFNSLVSSEATFPSSELVLQASVKSSLESSSDDSSPPSTYLTQEQLTIFENCKENFVETLEWISFLKQNLPKTIEDSRNIQEVSENYFKKSTTHEQALQEVSEINLEAEKSRKRKISEVLSNLDNDENPSKKPNNTEEK